MNTDILYIISQIFITVSLELQGYSFFVTNRHLQLIVVIISNICSAVCFMILGGYVAVAMAAVAIARDTVSNYINSHRMPGTESKITYTDCALLVLWMTLLTIGNMLTADGVLSMIPYFTTSLFTIAIWQKSFMFYRFSGMITNSLLILYNVFLHNIMGIILQTVLLGFAIVGFVSYLTERKHHVHL